MIRPDHSPGYTDERGENSICENVLKGQNKVARGERYSVNPWETPINKGPNPRLRESQKSRF